MKDNYSWLDPILESSLVRLLGYDHMLDLYAEDNGDAEDYHQMSRTLDEIRKYRDEAKSQILAHFNREMIEARIVEDKAIINESQRHLKSIGSFDLDRVLLDNKIAAGIATKEEKRRHDNLVTEGRAMLVIEEIARNRIKDLNYQLGEDNA